MIWWQILLIALGSIIVWFALSAILYRPIFKRIYDILISGLAIIVLLPLLLILLILTAICMRGNPFFIQERPGKNKKIFRLIKLRTMADLMDKNGNLLPDEKRLTKYGKFLRATSLDELFSLINILKGDISIVGPRPLLVKYLPLYNEEQSHRHDIRPGLTGLAQVNGRNALTWENKFAYDIKYVRSYNIFMDIKIIFKTLGKVFLREGINEAGQSTMKEFVGNSGLNTGSKSADDAVNDQSEL